jgi:RNase P/RNase MRP subunit p29
MSGAGGVPDMTGPAISTATLYATMPPALGGDAEPEPPGQLSLRALLPRARRAPPLPSDAALHSAVRNRALLLDKERGPRKAAAPPRARGKRDRAARRAGGSSTAVSPKVARRARSARAAVPLAERVYAAYEPLRDLWADYAAQVVGDGDWTAIGERLVRLDLHGAIVDVTRAKDPGLIGIKGILIVETANTILVITEKNRVVTVQKAAAIITITIAQRRYEVALPMLPYRASERSARKFKKKHLALF